MAVSLTAEYLYQGAQLLSAHPPRDLDDRNPVYDAGEQPWYAIARAIYALGIALVAPLGALYHLGAAGYALLQSENAQGHLDAAVCDLTGFMHIATEIALVAIVIFSVIAAIHFIHAILNPFHIPHRGFPGVEILTEPIVHFLNYCGLGVSVILFLGTTLTTLHTILENSEFFPSVSFARNPRCFAYYLPANLQGG